MIWSVEKMPNKALAPDRSGGAVLKTGTNEFTIRQKRRATL